ncbi:LytTR family DNA-binding domain-containing protein [uncultured Vagococcus sp.]|uniref:LytR/AlgR family response regulator transcription factor n=1 Tax=uncultured Vagococcus sp. TaxID=189676 RepID=UPI0028D564BB|nr:LytTR family DNA-binding domain-containing protein [uncultured Vagococcus sp.]
MLSIFICEDNLKEQDFIKNFVERFLMIEDYDMSLELVTDRPEEVLEHVLQVPHLTGLYFLDIHFNSDLNGIQLAAKIRLIDPLGSIVFVTTHSELVLTTFSYKVEALDFILKDTPEEIGERIHDCMRIANIRHGKQGKKRDSYINITIGHQIKTLNLSDINYFETATAPHKLVVHLSNRQFEFYGTIKEIMSKVNESTSLFVKVHQSYLVNHNNIAYVDKRERRIYFSNGDYCFASYRGMRQLKNL